MDDEEALKESVSNLKSAILLGRTDIIRSILSTAANCKSMIVIVLLLFLWALRYYSFIKNLMQYNAGRLDGKLYLYFAVILLHQATLTYFSLFLILLYSKTAVLFQYCKV